MIRTILNIIWRPELLLALSICINIALVTRVKHVETALTTIKSEGRLMPGVAVPPLEAETITGEPVRIDFSATQSSTFVYVLSPTCVWCARNEANLLATLNAITSHINIVLISLTNTNIEDYISSRRWPWPIYVNPSEQTRAAYRMGGTPQTILIDDSAIVVSNWMGAYTLTNQQQIETTFGVSLPGLLEPSQPSSASQPITERR